MPGQSGHSRSHRQWRRVGRLGTIVDDCDYGPIALALIKRSALTGARPGLPRHQSQAAALKARTKFEMRKAEFIGKQGHRLYITVAESDNSTEDCSGMDTSVRSI